MEPNTPTPLEADENGENGENESGNGQGQERIDQTQQTGKVRPIYRRNPTTASNTMSTPGSNTMSTTASNTINKMAANPSTAHKMANVVSQLDDEGKAQLDELVGEFDKGRHRRRERPKGQVASPDYHEQNPWHDQEREAVKFSLGEPFPRRDEAEDPEQVNKRRTVDRAPMSSQPSTIPLPRLGASCDKDCRC